MLQQLVTDVLRSELREDLRFRFPGEEWDRIHVPEPLKSVLAGLQLVKESVGRSLNLGASRSTLQIDNIAQALISRALDKGVEESVGDLFEFLSQDYSPCIDIVLLRGIKVPCTVELLENVFISKPEDVPSETLKRFIAEYPLKLTPFSFMSPTSPVDYTAPAKLPDSVLFRLKKVYPKFFQFDDPACQEFDMKDLDFFKKISELLTIVCPAIPINRRDYSELQAGSFLQGFTPRNFMTSYREAGSGICHDASIEDLELLKKVLSAYLELDDRLRDKLDVPIHRLNEAVRHDNPVDQAIDLGIALESLLLNDQGDSVQLSLQFRLRGAWLLGHDLVSRKEIHNHLRDLYSYRSTAVHSGRLTKKSKEYKRAQERLTAGLQLCADAIKALIFAKEVSWENVVLGGEI
ncbi:hypothetical protein [Pseudomonas purpurea]|uniref:hypothetical protein n=1 Tax=Pseudomonas purpurea TaxID=3136737 RepID=UPI00326434A1